jgi:nucleotide-binding universal stress UspA family protein
VFKHIAVAYFTPVNKSSAFSKGLSLAKNYGSKISLIEYFQRAPPKFFFFETSSEKESGKTKRAKARENLQKFKLTAEKEGVPIDILVKSTDSVSDSIVEYVREQKVDLLIVDHPHLSRFEETFYHDIVNSIHSEVHCNMLTLK